MPSPQFLPFFSFYFIVFIHSLVHSFILYIHSLVHSFNLEAIQMHKTGQLATLKTRKAIKQGEQRSCVWKRRILNWIKFQRSWIPHCPRPGEQTSFGLLLKTLSGCQMAWIKFTIPDWSNCFPSTPLKFSFFFLESVESKFKLIPFNV